MRFRTHRRETVQIFLVLTIGTLYLVARHTQLESALRLNQLALKSIQESGGPDIFSHPTKLLERDAPCTSTLVSEAQTMLEAPLVNPSLRQLATITLILCGTSAANQSLTVHANNSRAELIHWHTGRELYASGNVEAAIEHWKLVPNSDTYLAKVAAGMYFDENREQRDIKKIVEILALSERIDTRVTVGKASAYYAGYFIFRDGPLADPDRALLYAQHYAQVTASPLAYVILGRIYMSRSKFAEAETALLNSLDSNGDYWTARLELSRLYLRWGRFTEAIEQALYIPTTDDNYVSAQLIAGEAYYEMGEYRNVRQIALNLVETANDSNVLERAQQLLYMVKESEAQD